MMNIRKFFKVRNYYLLLGVIMINVGCTKNFLEYNTNPNEATDEMTDWDNVRTGSLLLQMEQNVLVVAQPGLNIGSDRYQTVEVMGGDGYVGYFGFPAPSINSAGRYNWDKRSWYGDMFTTNYLTTMNAWREIRKAINNDEDPRFSMAQILKVAAMHRVTAVSYTHLVSSLSHNEVNTSETMSSRVSLSSTNLFAYKQNGA